MNKYIRLSLWGIIIGIVINTILFFNIELYSSAFLSSIQISVIYWVGAVLGSLMFFGGCWCIAAFKGRRDIFWIYFAFWAVVFLLYNPFYFFRFINFYGILLLLILLLLQARKISDKDKKFLGRFLK